MTGAQGQSHGDVAAQRTVLVVGGYNGAWVLAGADLYDPKTGTFTATTDTTVPRQYHTETLCPTGTSWWPAETMAFRFLASADLYQ